MGRPDIYRPNWPMFNCSITTCMRYQLTNDLALWVFPQILNPYQFFCTVNHWYFSSYELNWEDQNKKSRKDNSVLKSWKLTSMEHKIFFNNCYLNFGKINHVIFQSVEVTNFGNELSNKRGKCYVNVVLYITPNPYSKQSNSIHSPVQ